MIKLYLEAASLHHNKNSKSLQAACCALSWWYPVKNVMRKFKYISFHLEKPLEQVFGQEFVIC